MVQYIPIAMMLGLGVLAGLVFTNINRLFVPNQPT
jgi:NADH:ubiquinone oxidoreductase subunit 3 (subunit A)